MTHLNAGKPGYDWLVSQVLLVIDLNGMNLHTLAVNTKAPECAGVSNLAAMLASATALQLNVAHVHSETFQRAQTVVTNASRR